MFLRGTSCLTFAFLSLVVTGDDPAAAAAVSPQLTLTNPGIDDQDDLCIWIHPSVRSQSTFIASDKYAGKLFVYDLTGGLVQTLSLPGTPGNIDVRYNFPFGEGAIDIVAYNDRDNDVLVVLRVDPQTRQLHRIDAGGIGTGANYGLALYRSPASGEFYAFTTSQSGAIHQYRLFESAGQVSATQVRSWSLGSITEGCVADDETGTVYFAQEDEGIWAIGAEPGDPTGGSSVARVGDASGLRDDVEGVAIYYAADGGGYLIASSQGNSTFKVYQRAAPHAFVTSFTVSGVGSTDGVDVTNVPLGPGFPYGAFVCHNDNKTPKPLEVMPYEDLGLTVDVSYWNPREWRSTASTELSWGDMKTWYR